MHHGAGIGRVRVQTPDPQALASAHVATGGTRYELQSITCILDKYTVHLDKYTVYSRGIRTKLCGKDFARCWRPSQTFFIISYFGATFV